MLNVKMRLLAVLTIQASLWNLVVCCSEINSEQQTIAERAKQANIIVYAEAVDKFPEYVAKHSDTYTMEFRHICVLKNEEQFFGNLDEATSKTDEGYHFNVSRLGYAQGWCLKVEAFVDEKYFLFLQPEEKMNTFFVERINVQTPIFNDTAETRSSLEEYWNKRQCVSTSTTGATSTMSKLDAKSTTMTKTSQTSTLTKTGKFVTATTDPSKTITQSSTLLSHSEFVAKPRISLTDKPPSVGATTTSTGKCPRLQPLNWLWLCVHAWFVLMLTYYETA